MRKYFVLAAVVLGCGGRATPPVAPAAGDEPKLDVPAPWIDSEGFYPRGVSPAAVPLSAALENPRAQTIAIRDATILTATGKTIERGVIVLERGTITQIGGPGTEVPFGARVVDGTGKFVTPGIIDSHSHIGVYASPESRAHADGNEAVAPVTAQARAEYGYWPQDPQIERAAAGGVTAALVLPGSANLVGGRGFTVAMRARTTAREAAFPGAPPTIKMACGENPKRNYGEKGGPQTRMGEYAAFRAAFHEAAAYAAKRASYSSARAQWEKRRKRAAELDQKAGPKGKPRPIPGEAAPEPVPVDLKLETLAAVLRGEVLVQIHCYRADEMANMMDVAREMGFRIRSFHHALEAYKIRDLLAAEDIAINTWADWWGFKLEAYDGIPENAALMTAQAGRATIHSDSAVGIQRLNQEAAKALASGRRAGLTIDDNAALRWITANPAWVLGIDSVTGTLETGKRADVVLWSASPFSVYARAELVVAGGEVTYDRAAGMRPSDYELGIPTDGGAP
jgi:imidazolonepropionase-like amidohydrolase